MARKKKQSEKKEPIGGVDYKVMNGYRVYKEELESLAEALNENMQFDPDDQIDPEAGLGELVTEISETFDEVFTTDEFEPEQWATLYKMGCMPVEPAEDEDNEAPVEEWPEDLMESIEDILEEAKDEPEPESEPEPEPEKKDKKGRGKKSSKKKEPEPEPEEEEEVDVEDLLKELKTKKKKKELDQFVEDNDINISTAERNPIKFKKMIADVLKGEGVEEKSESKKSSKKEKAESKKSSKKEKAESKKSESKKSSKREKVEKSPSKTKSHEEAFMDALDKLGGKKGTTMDKIAEKGNAIYCKANGGEGSEAMQRKQGLVIIKALIRYGVVEKEGKNIVLLEEE